MHLTLDLPLTPLQSEASFHRIVVFFQPIGKTLEFGDPLFLHSIKPLIEAFALSLSQHGGEFLDEFICLSDLLISLTQLSQVRLLPFQTLILFKGDPMGHLGSCWRTLGGRFDRGFIGRVNLLELAFRLSVCETEQSSAEWVGPSRCSLALSVPGTPVWHFCTPGSSD